MDGGAGADDGLGHRVERFDQALGRLREATPLTKATHRAEVQQLAAELLASDEGLRGLADRAHLLDAAGVFHATPWQEPLRLQPRLVAGGLLGEAPHPTMESLSELRMLAIATGRARHDGMGQEEALAFLERIVSLNLDFLFPRNTEAARGWTMRHRDKFERGARLFRCILTELPNADFLHLVVDEIEEICVQRRIWTSPVRRMIRLASELPGAADSDNERLVLYVEAILGPSPMSRRFREPGEYHAALQEADEAMLREESRSCAGSLRRTGLASAQHAVLVRHLRPAGPEAMGRALGLDAKGLVELERNHDLVLDLVTAAVHPRNSQVLYGLARLLERGLLSWPDVAHGLRAIAETPLRPEVEEAFLATRDAPDGVSAHAILLGGAIRMLGQPLGIGQGRNPTCQAARGMSLWSQHAPGWLLQLVTAAAREGDVAMRFQDQELHSKDLLGGLAWDLDPELDPVSLVLVPHLDRIYDEMMRRVAHLPSDGHQWVNPAMYGRIVPLGFATCFDTALWQVREYGGFVRRFFATHHPAYNGGRALPYPNPVGIFVTTAHADLLGLHAVSIQRVARDPSGAMRVYFFNPNDEGRQDWGQGVRPSIWRNGETEGESSLPFHEFASRLYAYHFNPFEEGQGYAVPEGDVQDIERLARTSWGRSYAWQDPQGP